MNRRQEQILEMVIRERMVRVGELAAFFHVSLETIRRDLQYMEEQELLKRVHGGAVCEASRAHEKSFRERESVNMKEKVAVARRVAELIQDEDTLAINVGTSTLEVIRALRDKKKLIIFTNSIEIAYEAIKNPTNKVFITGGFVRNDGGGVSGSSGVRFIENYHVDKAVISVGGISPEGGVTDFHDEEAAVTRSMLAAAREKIAVMDYTKLGITGLCKLCDLRELDVLAGDWRIPARSQSEIRELGVDVVIAPDPSQRNADR